MTLSQATQPTHPLPEGKILFRFTPTEEDNITGIDDMPAEYLVIENPEAMAGLVVYGRSARTGEWVANWQERHVVKRLLEMANLSSVAIKMLRKRPMVDG